MRNSKRISLPAAGLLLVAAAVMQPAQADHHGASMKAAVDTYLAAWNSGELEQLDAVFAEDLQREAPGGVSADGLDELKQAIRDIRTAYPDFEVVKEENHFHDDIAFIRWTSTGTHTGETDIPPTGKSINLEGLTMARFENGKIVSEKVFFDALDWMTQLGYTLQPPAAP